MADDATVQHEIADLLTRWGHARDAGDWQTLAACFHDDAMIHLSWMSGPAEDFLAGSKLMAANKKPGAHTKHQIVGSWILVNRARAFARCHVNLFSRAEIDGYEFDFQAWFRFLDRLERRDGAWRIVERTAVYEKDRMDPVVPGSVPDSYFAGLDLSPFPPQIRFLSYRHSRTGNVSAPDQIFASSDEAAALQRACEDWLAGA